MPHNNFVYVYSMPRRSQETLERELRAEQTRMNRERLSRMGPASRRATGLIRHVSPNSRAPLGAPSGSVLARQTGLSGTRRHGSRHMSRLMAFSELLDRRNAIRRNPLANSRPATSQNNVTESVNAHPFAEVVERAHSGHRPKKERMNQLPVAVPVRSFNSLFPVRAPHNESDGYIASQMHGPWMHAARARSRSRRRRAKGRARSASEPRRPRSH